MANRAGVVRLSLTAALAGLLCFVAVPAHAAGTVGVEAAFDTPTTTLLTTTGTDSVVNIEANIVNLTFPPAGGAATGFIELSATETFTLDGGVACDERHELFVDLVGTYDGVRDLQGTTDGQYNDTTLSGCTDGYGGEPVAFDFPWTATVADSTFAFAIQAGESSLTAAGAAFLDGGPWSPGAAADPQPITQTEAPASSSSLARTIGYALAGSLLGALVSLVVGRLTRRRPKVAPTTVERRSVAVAPPPPRSERAELVDRIDDMLAVIRERREREGAS